MVEEKLVRCIKDYENYKVELQKDKIYKLIIEKDSTFTYYQIMYPSGLLSTRIIDKQVQNMMMNNLEVIYSLKEAIGYIKNNFINFEILEYISSNTDAFAIKYNKCIILFKTTFFDNLPDKLFVEIHYNNLMNEVNIDNYMTEEGLKHICEFIKFVCDTNTQEDL